MGAHFALGKESFFMNRRHLLGSAGTMVAGAALLRGSPNETVSVGCIGVGGRGGIDFNAGVINYREDKWLSEKRTKQKPDRKVTTDSQVESSYLALEAFLKSVKDRSRPIATVENGRDAVLCCLLMREAVFTRQIATLEKLKAT
jgi:hypothetical protein